MKLLTLELKAKLQSQDPYHESGPGRELESDELIVHGKWFHPFSSWTWYAVSCSEDQDSGDVQFFGYVDGDYAELGYFWLSELEGIKLAGLPIERDLYWKPITLTELQAKVEREREIRATR